ncbi:glycosyltransferase [Clostridium sp. A1-XYC3]|uniref:Glycosyltransferase n=1 Tax=Clostridium tanneri TaxID=3037988 RepID=A0ABU4JR54_9CLOT|nr:glycosyltransferase [Clostridium sp. A1-XYC3]MDW8800636.1 glycosyltransferase [Clostridium sp. A1-XYC3]
MKVLILSISAGGGHSQAAEALKDYINLKDSNSEVKVIDAFKYINPLIDKVVIGSYLKTLKVTPSLYGKLYTHYEGDYTLVNTIGSKFIEIMTHKLLPLIEDFNPDILVSMHSFSTEMISIMKSKYKVAIPAITIITDYYPHSSWLHPNINAYIVSSCDMIEDMVSKGIPRNIIYNLGIPVKPGFTEKYDKKNTLNELGLSEEKNTILVMGGSLGIGKITDVYKELVKVTNEIQIIIITGSNRKLYYELMKLKGNSSKETRIIGYTDEVNKYMQACDLLLTKPGGLTITEALICQTPIGIFSPIPGQEEKNAEFLLKHDLAVNFFNIDTCKETIENLLSFDKKLDIMRKNFANFSKPYSASEIFKLMELLVKETDTSNKIKTSEKVFDKNSTDKNFFKSVEEYFMKTATKIFIGN